MVSTDVLPDAATLAPPRPPIAAYAVLARAIGARLRCIASGNVEWRDRHEERALAVIKDHFPSGGGFDNGTRLDLDKSTAERLVLATDFHHMNEHGFYDGWTSHEIIVTGSLESGFDMRVTGRDRREIKDYIGECFSSCLSALIAEYPEAAA